MATPVKHSANANSLTYGSERYYLECTVVAGGAGNPPTVKLTNDTSNPPGSAEIASIAFVADGKYTVTLLDSYFAVIYASADVDDTPDDGSYGSIGGWTNLQTSTPAVFTLFTRNAGGTKTAMAAGRAIRISIAFKKTYTGAAA